MYPVNKFWENISLGMNSVGTPLIHIFIVFSELEGGPSLRGGDCQQGLAELHEQRHQHLAGGLSQKITKI